MRTELMREMLSLLSTEGDSGFLMAADGFDESDDASNRRFGELLRLYVDIQTYVRMSLPIPLDKATRFGELNKSFETRDGFREYGISYSNSFGPFFLNLTADTGVLSAHLNYLEDEPVRSLSLNAAEADNNLAMILRNHRMDYMNELTISFQYNKRRQEAQLGSVMRELKSACLMRVTLTNISNRLNIIPAMFAGVAKVRKGCELIIGTTRVTVK